MTSNRDARARPSGDAGRSDLSHTVYISFAARYVTVSGTASVIDRLAASMEPMMTRGAEGVGAAALEVHRDGTRYIIRGPDMPGEEACLTEDTAARALYHRVVKIFIDARSDLVWMHAGVVSLHGGVIALVASSGHGKSTLVAELLGRGARYLSDEIAPIDSDSFTVLPFPLVPYKRVSAQDTPVQSVRCLDKVRVPLKPTELGVVPEPLERIYFLSYAHAGGPARMVDCSPGAAVIELLNNSLNPSQSRETEIGRLCALMRRVSSAYLHYSRVDEAADAILAARARVTAGM